MWPLFSWTSYHHNAAVTRLLNNLPSLEKQTMQTWVFKWHNPHWKDSTPTRVTKVLLPRSADGDLFQSQRWLRNHCPPEYSDSELMLSLTACRCRLHMGVEKCENPDVPCGAGLLLHVLVQSQASTVAVVSDETDDNSALSHLWLYCKKSYTLDTHTKQILIKP